ncbi:MAG: NAD(+) synthase [Cellulosilyticaceae bacterium]
MKQFDAVKVTDELITWIRNYFKENGEGCCAVVGISGGKDSSVVAALCAKALGTSRVVGVLMPSGEQPDIDCSHMLCNHLGIKSVVINIGETERAAKEALLGAAKQFGLEQLTSVTMINTPARIRMTTVYGVAGLLNGRVANTCNLSEDWVGYATKFGDGAGDFSPLAQLTVTEVKAIGRVLGLPNELVDKVPIDGLCGKTDEENLGFSYDTLDKYIREGICEDVKIKEKIDRMQKNNMHKLLPMPHFK